MTSGRPPAGGTSRSRSKGPAPTGSTAGTASTVVDQRGDLVRLLVPVDADLSGLLAAASAAGPVRRFAFQPPALSELFMEAVQS